MQSSYRRHPCEHKHKHKLWLMMQLRLNKKSFTNYGLTDVFLKKWHQIEQAKMMVVACSDVLKVSSISRTQPKPDLTLQLVLYKSCFICSNVSLLQVTGLHPQVLLGFRSMFPSSSNANMCSSIRNPQRRSDDVGSRRVATSCTAVEIRSVINPVGLGAIDISAPSAIQLWTPYFD